jgi:hypothetical protein
MKKQQAPEPNHLSEMTPEEQIEELRAVCTTALTELRASTLDGFALRKKLCTDKLPKEFMDEGEACMQATIASIDDMLAFIRTN